MQAETESASWPFLPGLQVYHCGTRVPAFAVRATTVMIGGAASTRPGVSACCGARGWENWRRLVSAEGGLRKLGRSGCSADRTSTSSDRRWVEGPTREGSPGVLEVPGPRVAHALGGRAPAITTGPGGGIDCRSRGPETTAKPRTAAWWFFASKRTELRGGPLTALSRKWPPS